MEMKAIYNGDNPIKITGSMKEKLEQFKNRHSQIERIKETANDDTALTELAKLQEAEQKVVSNLSGIEFIVDYNAAPTSDVTGANNLSDELSDFSLDVPAGEENNVDNITTDLPLVDNEPTTVGIDNDVAQNIIEDKPIEDNEPVVSSEKSADNIQSIASYMPLENSEPVIIQDDKKDDNEQNISEANNDIIAEPRTSIFEEMPTLEKAPDMPVPVTLPEVPITEIGHEEPLENATAVNALPKDEQVTGFDEPVMPIYDFDEPEKQENTELSQNTIDAIDSIVNGSYNPQENVAKVLEETTDLNSAKAPAIFAGMPDDSDENTKEDKTSGNKENKNIGDTISETEAEADNSDSLQQRIHEEIDKELPVFEAPVAKDSEEELNSIYKKVDVEPQIPNKSKTRDIKDLTLFVDYNDYNFTFGQQHYKKDALTPKDLDALDNLKAHLNEKEFVNRRTVQYNKITAENKRLNKKIVTLSKTFTKTIDKLSKEYTKTTEQLTKQAEAAKAQIETDRVEKVQTQKLNASLTDNIKEKEERIDTLIKENTNLKQIIEEKSAQIADLENETKAQAEKIKVFEEKLNTVLGIVKEVKGGKK